MSNASTAATVKGNSSGQRKLMVGVSGSMV
jgi:tubulin polyglutamylase TTLL6/13